MTATTFTCNRCNKTKINNSSVGTGYAGSEEGGKICYDCCGEMDRELMENLKPKEKISGFYLVQRSPRPDSLAKSWYLENWPGTYSQLVYVWTTTNNWGYTVYHFENNGGKVPFYGRLTGDNKQCVDFLFRKVE